MKKSLFSLSAAIVFATCFQAKAMTEEERFRQQQGAEARGRIEERGGGRGYDHGGRGGDRGGGHYGGNNGNNGCYEIPGGRVQCGNGGGGGYYPPPPAPYYPPQPPPYYPPQPPPYYPPNDRYSTQDIQCESLNYGYNECRFDGYRVIQVYMVNRRSNSACDYGRTYGIGQDYIWVDQGCRAIFRVERR